MTALGRYAFALAPLAAAALWGGMYVVSKWSFEFVPPVTLGFLRVALGGVALWLGLRAVTLLRPGSHSGVDRADWPGVVELGGWVALTIATQFLGTHLTNASQGSLLTVLTPVFVVVLGATLLGEGVTRLKAAGTGLAGVGTVVVLAGQYELAAVAAGNAAGVGLLVLASLAWAGYTVRGVAVVRRYSALTAATYSTLAAIPMLGLLAAAELWYLGQGVGTIPVRPAALLAVAYLGLAATAAAWYLWYKGLEFVPSGTVAVFFFVQPVVGSALGAALLGEQVGPGFLAGGALIGAGVWVVSRDRGAGRGSSR
ncbi:DMT family transporter [Haloglomus salinum]|uniref:DMT family transporter n=1 Tax=Haloglomus salinum TaxID=2962673 RepID=UPI0020CA0D27|nr:DMT family transporter [Haloglomus salinum]